MGACGTSSCSSSTTSASCLTAVCGYTFLKKDGFLVISLSSLFTVIIIPLRWLTTYGLGSYGSSISCAMGRVWQVMCPLQIDWSVWHHSCCLRIPSSFALRRHLCLWSVRLWCVQGLLEETWCVFVGWTVLLSAVCLSTCVVSLYNFITDHKFLPSMDGDQLSHLRWSFWLFAWSVPLHRWPLAIVGWPCVGSDPILFVIVMVRYSFYW